MWTGERKWGNEKILKEIEVGGKEEEKVDQWVRKVPGKGEWGFQKTR